LIALTIHAFNNEDPSARIEMARVPVHRRSFWATNNNPGNNQNNFQNNSPLLVITYEQVGLTLKIQTDCLSQGRRSLWKLNRAAI